MSEEIRILVVDDDVDSCEIIKMGLEIEGYDVRIAPEGRTAIAMMDDFAPQLVVLDLMMPVLDGIRFLNWLRKEKSDLTTKVIIHTAVGSGDLQQEALDAGANLVMQKPRQLQELLNSVRQVLAQ